MMYQKKPVVIEALQWDGSMDGMLEINKHWPLLDTTSAITNKNTRTVFKWNIKTLEGQHCVSFGDYIIKGVKGEFYPCKPDIFDMTYELAVPVPAPPNPETTWRTPTPYLQRFGDAMQALCQGHRPSDQMLAAWLDIDADDDRLQIFACKHGFSWAQGIGLIDAAQLAAGQPTEGVRHERRNTPQPASMSEKSSFPQHEWGKKFGGCPACGKATCIALSCTQPAQPTLAATPLDFEDLDVSIVLSGGGFNPLMNNGVRVTHRPTGLYAECTTERSQHANQHQAIQTLTQILSELKQ